MRCDKLSRTSVLRRRDAHPNRAHKRREAPGSAREADSYACPGAGSGPVARAAHPVENQFDPLPPEGTSRTLLESSSRVACCEVASVRLSQGLVAMPAWG
jgi:hypothetical protein